MLCQFESWIAGINWLAVLTVLIAGFVAYVAWQQWRTATHKLKLDLFEKRFAAFEVIWDFVNFIVSTGGIEGAQLYTFWVESSAASFLFGEEVGMVVKEIYDRAIKLQ